MCSRVKNAQIRMEISPRVSSEVQREREFTVSQSDGRYEKHGPPPSRPFSRTDSYRPSPLSMSATKEVGYLLLREFGHPIVKQLRPRESRRSWLEQISYRIRVFFSCAFNLCPTETRIYFINSHDLIPFLFACFDNIPIQHVICSIFVYFWHLARNIYWNSYLK